MKSALFFLLKLVLVLVVSAPIGVFATWLSMPLWDAFEARGIESVGHSGPSGWCYVASYCVIVAAGLLVLWLSRARPEHELPS
jgi:protein-S-isoprenylcysteine O-methyltransferase Ste14